MITPDIWYCDNLTIWSTFWQFDWHFDIIREISLDLDWSGEIWTDLGRSQQICWDLNRSGLTFTFWHLTLLTFDIASASKKKMLYTGFSHHSPYLPPCPSEVLTQPHSIRRKRGQGPYQQLKWFSSYFEGIYTLHFTCV